MLYFLFLLFQKKQHAWTEKGNYNFELMVFQERMSFGIFELSLSQLSPCF